VYITCNSVGQFFQDQKYERQLACLAENDSSTTASWVGVRGTFSTDGVIQNIRCIEVVCNLVDLFHLMEEGGSVVDLLLIKSTLVLNLAQMTSPAPRLASGTRLLACASRRRPPIQLLGRQKQYVPPTTEATAAWQTGMVAITIVILFFTCIVVLDLATIRETSACSKPTFST
uniref:Triple gene block 3 protein n=1 Tax=Macrostomum lignano TaxID=282301 RepID=A0A1I8F964_9PLAT